MPVSKAVFEFDGSGNEPDKPLDWKLEIHTPLVTSYNLL